MLYAIVTLLLYTVPASESPPLEQRMQNHLPTPTAVFSTLRVYAITGRKWHFALATFLTGIVAFASNLVGPAFLSF